MKSLQLLTITILNNFSFIQGILFKKSVESSSDLIHVLIHVTRGKRESGVVGMITVKAVTSDDYINVGSLLTQHNAIGFTLHLHSISYTIYVLIIN